MDATSAQMFDALALDNELERLLLNRWQTICVRLDANLAALIQPELRASLHGLLWYCSATCGEATPGLALLGLHRAITTPSAQRTSSMRRALYGAVVILVPWAWARFSALAASPSGVGQRHWTRWIRRVEAFLAVASLLTTFQCILAGRASTFPMALLGIQIVQRQSVPPQQPAFDFMEQQVIKQPQSSMCASLALTSMTLALPHSWFGARSPIQPLRYAG